MNKVKYNNHIYESIEAMKKEYKRLDKKNGVRFKKSEWLEYLLVVNNRLDYELDYLETMDDEESKKQREIYIRFKPLLQREIWKLKGLA